MVTNKSFAEKIGCTESYASYLRNGHRLPSGGILSAIILKYQLPPVAAMTAYLNGKQAFGSFLETHVFGAESDPSERPDELADHEPEPETDAVRA
jgi:hypothetical protein